MAGSRSGQNRAGLGVTLQTLVLIVMVYLWLGTGVDKRGLTWEGRYRVIHTGSLIAWFPAHRSYQLVPNDEHNRMFLLCGLCLLCGNASVVTSALWNFLYWPWRNNNEIYVYTLEQ